MKVKVTIGIGFPQGGVCSAKFWIIAFDKAYRLLIQELLRDSVLLMTFVSWRVVLTLIIL